RVARRSRHRARTRRPAPRKRGNDLSSGSAHRSFRRAGHRPGLRKLWSDAAMVLLEAGIPLEAILAEFYLSGEIERTYRAMREIGPARQWQLHSQTSQYGSMSRAERFASVDLMTGMRAAVDELS